MASAWHLLGLSEEACDVSKPAGPSSHEGALIVCIDVEASTYGGNEILEVGVAMLDTNDLVGVAPGAGGTNWIKLIKARHFVIRDHCHIVNKRFATGCPDKTLFAISEYITEAAAKYKIPPCWMVKKPATATTTKKTASSSSKDSKTLSRVDEKLPPDSSNSSPYKPVAFVGHDLRSDTNLIGRLGISMKLDHVIASYDTQVLSGARRKLSEMLMNLGIPCDHTHNGCNDAVFTLQAFIAIVSMSPEARNMFVMVQRARAIIPPAVKINVVWDPKILVENKKVYDHWAPLRRKQKNAMYAKRRQLQATTKSGNERFNEKQDPYYWML